MLSARATARRALVAAFAAGVIAASNAAPAAADHQVKNPEVGGSTLYRDGLLVDGAPAPLPQPAATAFLIADLDTGEILAAQNAHTQHPMASTLKMLTALTVLPRVDLDTIYTATDADINVDGSKVGIVPGSTYTGRQLFEGMFLVSGNDAAQAVANLNGGIDGTVDQMQAEAWRVQAYDTVVRNPSGLDAPGQVSSPYDLALMARAGMARKDFASFAGLSNSTFPVAGIGDPTSRQTFEIWNQNDLVTGGYDGGIGVKSGFTTEAGRTIAAAAQRNGKRYLVTLMGIEGNTYRTGEAFLDWAFSNGDKLKPIGTLVEPKFAASQSDAAVVVPAHSVVPAVSIPSPTAGRARLFIAVITLASCLVIWWRLRAQHRRAMRRTSAPMRAAPAAREPEVVDLRSGAKQDLRV